MKGMRPMPTVNRTMAMRNDHAGHFQAHEPALGRTAKAHVCAGHECGAYNHSRKQPDIHDWAPRARAILGTLARSSW